MIAISQIRLLASIATTVFVATTSARACTNSPVTVRLAPSLQTSSTPTTSWIGPEDSWQWGTWYVTQSSSSTYLQLQNLQAFFAPVLPSCTASSAQNCPLGTYSDQRSDLTTYTLPSNDSTPSPKVYSAFGYDTPARLLDPSLGPEWNAVYVFNGTKSLSSASINEEVISWGYDGNGNGFLILYETANVDGSSSPDLAFLSRVESGIASATDTSIKTELKGLGNASIDKLLTEMGIVVVNGARDGLAPFVCDTACQNNKAQ